MAEFPAVVHLHLGAAPVLLVAPHAVAPLEPARGYVADNPQTQAAFADHVAEWHDVGSAELIAAAAPELEAPALCNALPRGLLDLNRGWCGRPEAKETLFGKGAVDATVAAWLAPGARETLQQRHREAHDAVRRASAGKRGLLELHSYGELGSTYDRLNGGRPVRRPRTALVDATPWASAFPVGLARLLPGDLRGTPWPLHRAVADALAAVDLAPGPHPYPAQGPWTLSMRFVADRWFQWLGFTGRLPAATAARLSDLAWTDEQHPDLDLALDGQAVAGLEGARDVAAVTLAWSADASELGARFLRETGTFGTTIELRLDLEPLAEVAGRAVAAGVRAFLSADG
ncbi:MAG: hypothetical protein FJ100_11210 [Deltaproteobacteria bacterium]|nr:hypothetical protein [Deltaproteobacteria bacterium]